MTIKIEGITNGCSKPYFGNALKRMIVSNPENCAIISDYNLAEQTEITRKREEAAGLAKAFLTFSPGGLSPSIF